MGCNVEFWGVEICVAELCGAANCACTLELVGCLVLPVEPCAASCACTVESNPGDVKPIKPTPVEVVGGLKPIPVVPCAANCVCTVEVVGCLELPVVSSEDVEPDKPTPESKDAPKAFPEFWCSLFGGTDELLGFLNNKSPSM